MNIPDRIYVEWGTEKIYNYMRKKLGKNFTYSDIFSLAMIYGYRNGVRSPLQRKRELFRINLNDNNFDHLMSMLYIVEFEDSSEKFDFARMCNIAEQYANAGLELMLNDIDEDCDRFLIKLSADFYKLNRDNKLLNALEELNNKG